MQTHHANAKTKNHLAAPSKPAQESNAASYAAPGAPTHDKRTGLVSQQLLSQDSIAHYVEDAEFETQEERKRLALQESERKQFANAIISQTSHHHEQGEHDDEAGPN